MFFVEHEKFIITGGATGADYLGLQYAITRIISHTEYPADWVRYGVKAGPIRNEEMAKAANACICFWDGKSRGTRNMIENALKYNLKLMVIPY